MASEQLLPVPQVLISAAQIQRRVHQLARRIERDHADRDLVIVALLNGTVLFLADLIRELKLPVRIDFMGVSSYGDGTRPGRLVFTRELKLDVRGRDVLLLDDILDTGRTLHAALARLRALRPRRVRVCVLLDKRARREQPVRTHYIGFAVPDAFVVGYGLDYQEHYRQLPFVGVLPAEALVVETQPRLRYAARANSNRDPSTESSPRGTPRRRSA